VLADFFKWLNLQPQGTASFIGTLAGSTLGFLALLAGALFNAHLNRRRDDRQRQHDRMAIAAALYGELEMTQANLLDNAELLRQGTGEQGFLLPPPWVRIMPKLIDRMGLLGSETVRTVTATYIVIEQTRRELLTLGAKPSDNPDNDHLWLPAAYAPTVIKMNTVKADYIGKALAALEPYLRP
jgi:hypothetical protein